MDTISKPLMYGGLGSMYAIGAIKKKLDKNPDAAATATDTVDASKHFLKSIPNKIIKLSKENNWSGDAVKTTTKTIPEHIKTAVTAYNTHSA